MSQIISISEFRNLSLLSLSGLFLSDMAGELQVTTVDNHDESVLMITDISECGVILEAIHFQDEATIVRIKGRKPNLIDMGIFNVMTRMLQHQKLTSSYLPSYTSDHLSQFMYAGSNSVFTNLNVTSLGVYQNEIYFVQAQNKWHLRKVSFKNLLADPNCLSTAKTVKLFGKAIHDIGRINKSGIMPLTIGDQFVEYNLQTDEITNLAVPAIPKGSYILGDFRLSEKIDKLVRVIVGPEKMHLVPLVAAN